MFTLNTGHSCNVCLFTTVVFTLQTSHDSCVYSIHSRQQCLQVVAVVFILHISHGISVNDGTAAMVTMHTNNNNNGNL